MREQIARIGAILATLVLALHLPARQATMVLMPSSGSRLLASLMVALRSCQTASLAHDLIPCVHQQILLALRVANPGVQKLAHGLIIR